MKDHASDDIARDVTISSAAQRARSPFIASAAAAAALHRRTADVRHVLREHLAIFAR